MRSRFVIVLVLVSQLLGGAFARVATAHAATTAPSCHEHAMPSQGAPSADHGCCANGDCPCLLAAALPPVQPVTLLFVRAEMELAPDSPAPPAARLAVILRPPIA